MRGPISDRLRAMFPDDAAVWHPQRRAAAAPDRDPDTYRGYELGDQDRRGEVEQ